ncbi:hypothetical protein BDD12DRAFT_887004 [Trichophaea hybrida]|nr:hypothetical protein BDD12DRAFT_887004 [Trichophaea hybrida]
MASSSTTMTTQQPPPPPSPPPPSPPPPPPMSVLDPSVLHASKRKRTGNLVLQDYPVNVPNSPVVSFFGFSVEAISTQLSSQVVTTPPDAARSSTTGPHTRSHCPSPEAPGQLPSLSWSFLAHPVLPHLRKWPGLPLAPLTTTPTDGSTPESQSEPPSSPEATEVAPPSLPLKLLSLLDIPPVASSLASHLYGHDLLNLRLLNSTFHGLLSSETSDTGERPYYHTLLLKSLLCPRQDTISEPAGVSCKSAGGNVGPCVLCSETICTTCVSPEIWTVKRYRYICPPCCGPSNDPTCRCQDALWLCRRCYKTHWLADLEYDAGGWFTNHAVTCGLCNAVHTHKTDARLPEPTSYLRGKKMEFKEWFVRVKPVAGTKGEEQRRPVGCSWCRKRVDPKQEEWTLRPVAIRRGEEKGRVWIRELERRRREREREGRENEEEEEDQQPAGN